jgi:protein SCO1/2
VTGEKTAMDRVLDGLNAFTPDYTQHPIMVLVGDPRSGTWSRLFGFPRPDAILERLDALAATRAGASLQTSMKEN